MIKKKIIVQVALSCFLWTNKPLVIIPAGIYRLTYPLIIVIQQASSWLLSLKFKVFRSWSFEKAEGFSTTDSTAPSHNSQAFRIYFSWKKVNIFAFRLIWFHQISSKISRIKCKSSEIWKTSPIMPRKCHYTGEKMGIISSKLETKGTVSHQ